MTAPPVRVGRPRTFFADLWNRYEWAIDHGYQATPSALALYRIGVAAYLLLARPLPSFRWMASYPDDFYSPPLGLPQVWGGVPSSVVLAGLEFGLLAAITLLLLGWRTPWTSLAVGLGGIIANSAYFSFGKIEHTIIIWTIPLAFSFSGWGSVLSLDERAGRTSRATAVSSSRSTFLLGLLLAVAYFTAAVPKLLAGWLSFENSATRLHFLLFHHQLERDHLLAPLAVDIDNALLWEAADWGTVAFELGIAVTLLWPVLHRRVIVVAWLFHLSVLLVMNIGFIGAVPAYPAFFLPLLGTRQARNAAAAIARQARRPWVWGAGTVAVVLTSVSDGLWTVATRDVLGLDGIGRDLILFLTGLTVLIAVGVATRGYRQPSTVPAG